MLYWVGQNDPMGQHARYGLSVLPQSFSPSPQVLFLRIAQPASGDMMNVESRMLLVWLFR